MYATLSRPVPSHAMGDTGTESGFPSTPSTKDRLEAVVEAISVTVEHDQRRVLDGVDLSVWPGQRWVVLGPNGCGKSTLLRVLALRLHPSRGTVRVDGRTLGSFDLRPVRARIALVSASLATELRGALTAREAVITAAHGALETWWNDYDHTHEQRALECLHATGMADFVARPIASLSSGELQRVLLARALMVDPLVVLFDEPSARLDLGGREDVVKMLDDASAANPALPFVLVTHHVEEIPQSATHCLLLRNGATVTSGPIEDVLTAHNVAECFGLEVEVERRANGRWMLQAR